MKIFGLFHFILSFLLLLFFQFCFRLLCFALPWIRTIENSHAHFLPCIFIHSVCVNVDANVLPLHFVRSFVHFVWLRNYTPFHFVIFAVCFTLFSLFLFLPLVSRIVIKFQKLNRIVRFSLCSRVGIRVSVYASAFWLVVPQHSMRECG